MENKRKIINNMSSGILYQFITLALGILIPRLVLVTLGSEANGLLSSANQVVVYLALLEGGMGLSITQALYGPMAQNQYDDINGIMSASNIFYRNVGKWYFVGLMLVSVVYTFTVSTTLPKVTVFWVVILTGLPQVINFFFQGKYRTLITVNGKGYVLTNLNTVVYAGTSITKIVLLLSGFGVVAIQVMYFIISIIQMAFILWYVKKEFPWLNLQVKPMKERIGQRTAVVWHQISGFVFSNTDILMLTYFCDLKVVSIYSMYNMFFSMVESLVSNVTGSFVFVMGQTYNSDKKRYLQLHNSFETLNMMLVFSFYTVLYICILPFLELYLGGVTDINYIDHKLPILFALIKLIGSGRFASQKVIEYAGKFKETQAHAVIEMIINVVVSMVGVIYCGIYGVLLGTIVSMLVRGIFMIYYSSKHILQMSQTKVYVKWFINALFFGGLIWIASYINIKFDSYVSLVAYAVVTLFIALITYGMSTIIYDKTFVKMIVDMLKGKIIK